ncbi:MAG TPA: PAS domain S-box protein, partial [Acidimicrobiales bacterium]|nr:PAS domain S-box protein [Acidimicrobiales bacterium]
DIPFVVLSGTIGEEAAVRALKAGAADVVLKGNMSRLASVARRELTAATERRIRRAAEAALRESEALKTAILQSVFDAVISIDAEGRIIEFNRAAEQVFGFTRSEVLGEVMVDLLVPPELRNQHREGFALYLATRQATILNRRLTMSALRRDGTEFPVELAVVALDLPGETMFTANLRDITGQERMQRELAQSQRLESLGQLAGGVAHDFNNLLAVIMNYAEFVRSEVEGNEQASSDVAAIVQAAEQAAQLTRQLLAFGRREVVHPRLVELNEVLAQVQQLLARTIGDYLQISSRTQDDLSSVFIDPGQVEQVLLNLALNARDAMPGGGELTFRTEDVYLDDLAVQHFSELTPGRYVRLRVSDSGMGMSKATLERAFEPFFTTKPKGEGSGLGLATCYGIVRQAGGDIHLYSEPSQGTTVSIYLPAAEDETGAPTVDSAQSTYHPAGGTEVILVVEDEPAFREMARRILEAAGYTALTAADAPEGLEAVGIHGARIDLILTDVVMPGHSGIEMAAQLRATHPEIPLIFMSGYAESIVLGTTEVAPDELLAKPFNQTTLLERVRTVLDRRGPRG